uniref:Uncharacterized protein n=1 Tax=viral metagenome TaxID=1070528 RepID=A0A6M3K538_9ZZZZ
MKRTFLHTRARFDDATGTPVRAYVDCDSIPIIKIYNTSGTLLETPTVSKETVYFANGHYSYLLDWRLYTAGSWYYDVVTYIYNSQTMVSDRRYFQFNDVGTETGNADDGFNINLGRALVNVLQLNPTIVSLIGHSESTQKFIWATTLKSGTLDEMEISGTIHPEYPYLAFNVIHQKSIQSDSNISTMRESIIELKVFDDDNDTLLLKLNDKIIDYFMESNDYHGLNINTADDIFRSFSITYEQSSLTPKGLVYWDKDKQHYEIGVQFVIKASCF